MTISDKEIALDLTKAYLEHLNIRAQNDSTRGTYVNIEDICITYTRGAS
ncbi:hypothetical protein A5810_003080 [Enterococcus faecium]|uniref:Uncharacterized protein n=1 Tax=Enterococcus faecium TaxID=1352 RepID=A0A242ASF7_ENTFC|nr:hypothetical protein A5810_003080 [Enterococcus faecium]